MHRSRTFSFALLATGALTAAAIAQASSSSWDRISALEQQASERAKKMHLADPCHQGDPTPEVRFKQVAEAHPGQTVTVTGSGTFGKNPQVVPGSDQVKLVSAQATSTAITAKLAVDRDAFPQKVELGVVGWLCPQQDSEPALEVVSDTSWTIDFPNGWKLRLATHGRQYGAYKGEVRWDGKGGPKVQTAWLKLGSDPGQFDVTLQPTAQDQAAIEKRRQEADRYQIDPKVQARAEKAQASFEACSKLGDVQKGINCMQARQAEFQAALQALSKEQMKKIAIPAPAGIGCLQLSLETKDGHSATAIGRTCVGTDQLEGKGSVQVVR